MKNENNFYEKLIEAKKSMGAIKKTSTNPFFKSKYADLQTILEVVEPALLENGLLLIQPIRDGKVTTIITDGIISIESSIEIGSYNKPQDLGSAITYYRRYTLQALLSLSAEDDDGNQAQKGALPPITMERFNKALQAIEQGTAKKEDLSKFTLTEEQKNILKNG